MRDTKRTTYMGEKKGGDVPFFRNFLFAFLLETNNQKINTNRTY